MNSDEADNLEAAMEKIAETLKMTRKPSTGSKPGEPAQKQVIVRASESDHIRWKSAAEKAGVSMAEFIREAVNEACANIMDCTHPENMRKKYPWSEFCLRCEQRIK